MHNFIVVDVETSGLIPEKHQILSIGAVDYRTGENFYGECRIYQYDEIDPKSLEMNGFTEEDCRDASKDTPLELYYKFREWATGRGEMLAGQCVGNFDIQFLKVLENKSKHKSWSYKYSLDLHSMAYARFKESLSLREICERLEVVPEPTPHNSLIGAMVATSCFDVLLKDVKAPKVGFWGRIFG